MTFNATDLLSNSDTSRATTSIVNRFSDAGYVPVLFVGAYGKQTISGALTANTLSTVLNITGTAGIVSVLAVSCADATSRTIRIQLTVDGNVIYNVTSAANTTTGNGCPLIGYDQSGTFTVAPNYPIKFRSSFKFEVASSITESAKFNIIYKYNTEA